jgi:hypothetical protein
VLVANNGHLPAALILSSGISLFIRTSTMSVTARSWRFFQSACGASQNSFGIVWISASSVLDWSDQADYGNVTPFKIEVVWPHVDRRFAPTLLLLLRHYHRDNGRLKGAAELCDLFMA